MKKENILNHPIGYMALFLILLLCSIDGWTQENLIKSEYGYRRYTTQDGVPNMMVISFYQDDKGMIWIATNDGFSCFDGIKITNYFANTGKCFCGFRSKPNGELWAYATDSIHVLDKNRTIVRSIKPTDKGRFENLCGFVYMPNDYFIVNGVEQHKKWLMKQVADTLETIVEDLPELDMISNDPYLDLQTNKLYLPCWTKKRIGVFDINRKKITHLENSDGEFILKHSTLGLLALASDGIYKINENSLSKIVDLHLERNQKAIELKDGSLIIMDRETIYRYTQGRIEMLYSDPSTYFINIFADREENIWLGTYTKGMYNFFHFDFRNTTLEKEKITLVTENEQGDYLMGTLYGNLYNYSGEKTEKINYPRRGHDINFWNGSCFFNNTIFMPRGDGILKYKNKQFSWLITNEFYTPEGKAKGFFKKIIPIENNNLLILNQLAIYFFDENEKLKKEITPQELGVKQFNDVIMSSRGEIIVACSGGSNGNLFILGDSVVQRDLKFYNPISSLEQDFAKNIWCGSNNYLLLLCADTLKIVQNFQEASIKALKAVNNDYLLISTTKGIYFFNSKKYLENGEIQLMHYDHLNGMNGIEPMLNALYRDSKGWIWLIANESIVSFDPEQLIRKCTAPILSIQKCLTSADNVNWENAIEADKIIFDHKHNNIRFEFIGLKYSAVENVRYYYRLVGFQDSWSESTKNREITFNNLSPGDYVFEIYADAGTDESRCETQTFAFTIKPAFWQTAWFLIAGIAALMLGSAGIALHIQRRKNRVLLEKLHIEKELNELRISSIRLKAIPHFNANILAAIEYYIANRTKEEAMRILGIYSDFTIKTLSEVDKAARPLSEELAYIKMYLDLEKIRFLDKFDFHINVENNVNQTVQLPNMILHTYCENAVKHGLMPLKSGGILTINVSQHDSTVCVSVEDNGVGRTYATQNPQPHSTKQGLSILNRQIEIYNRFNQEKIIQRIDDFEAGTRFTVEVPTEFIYIN